MRHRRIEDGGGEGVHADAAVAPLDGEELGQAGDAALGGEVAGRAPLEAADAEDGAEVDDVAVALAQEVLRGGAAAVPQARQVRLHDLAEHVVVGVLRAPRAQVGDAGVVDEHVDRAEVVPGGLHERLDLLVVGHVAGDGEEAAARGLDERGRIAEAVEAAGGADDVGPALRQRRGPGDAEAVAGAGDDDRLAFHREHVVGHGGILRLGLWRGIVRAAALRARRSRGRARGRAAQGVSCALTTNRRR